MNASKRKILAISGSTRIRSTNESILRIIAETYNEWIDVELFDGIAKLPHFNPDIDDDHVETSVKDFREKIEHADGVIICTPEYVFSLPGSLKNAIEWTVSTTVFSDKPAALIVASGLGEKAYESLILVMKTVGANMGDSTLLIKGARSKLNALGQISDQSVLQDIDSVMKSFMKTIDDRVV